MYGSTLHDDLDSDGYLIQFRKEKNLRFRKINVCLRCLVGPTHYRHDDYVNRSYIPLLSPLENGGKYRQQIESKILIAF